MNINKNDPLPLHYQLKSILQEKFRYETWAIGDLFPTEKELMQQYQLSSTTVRRALSELVQEGILERKAGKGTFIKKLPVQETLGRLTGFYEEMKQRGLNPSSKIISYETIQDFSQQLMSSLPLQLFDNQEMFLIEKLQNLNNEPIAYTQSYWPYHLGSELAKHDLEKEGLYEIALREFQVFLTKAEQTISATIADSRVASLLQIAEGSPLLIMERMAFAGNKPVEYSFNLYRIDRYNYHVTLYHDSRDIHEITLVNEN